MTESTMTKEKKIIPDFGTEPVKQPGMMQITGYSPSNETLVGDIATNAAGGKQTKIRSKITEVPPLALVEVGEVMGLGSTNYPREADGTPNWHRIDAYSNLDHALEHVANFLVERNRADRNEDKMREELAHFAARAMMALEMFLIEERR